MTEQLERILSRYKGERGDLIPLLQEVQTRFGYLPEEAMQGVAKFLRLSESIVYGVSTFYAQFKFTPTGKHTIKVCRGTACHVRGVTRILEEVEKQLGIKPGGTTPDLEYSLESIACFGSCALSPVMVVDETVYGRMTHEKVREILKR
ncbi:MAG: NADH-quinone oxidoreductase subunit NuoE [Dehalococcoidia bacterium]|nr:NADH-quinone oxidoreductase subunit NuoE [Dehalococcoidia bacterium]